MTPRVIEHAEERCPERAEGPGMVLSLPRQGRVKTALALFSLGFKALFGKGAQ